MHTVISTGVSPATALAVGLKVDADALPPGILDTADLDDPATTWGLDAWLCSCGGKRKVHAIVTSHRTAEEILRSLGLLPAAPPRLPVVALAQAPPQLELPMA